MARVLIVDDDPTVLRLLEVNFRLEGFETLTAATGEQALRVARSELPDAIVLDVMMPGVDGHQVYAALRDDPATAGIAVVFLTGRSAPSEAARYVAEGVDYLTKAVDPADLVALVRRRTEVPS
jgi:DNA-binding response OmpR family regulator